MSTEHSKLERLANDLIRKSNAGDVRWEEGPGSSFIAPFNAATVVVRSVDSDGDAPYELQVLNASGSVLSSRRTEVSMFGTETPWNNMLTALYSSARRVALNVEDVLDNLLGDVGEGRQPPPDDDDIPF